MQEDQLTPQKKQYIFFGILAAAIVIFLVGLFSFLSPPDELDILHTYENENLGVELYKSDPVKGSAKAKITIVEFADFTCEHCKQSSGILKQLLSEYPNDVRVVWKDLPANQTTQPSKSRHIAAQCAHQQNRFWEYHDQLFSRTDQTLTTANFITIAKDLGLDAFAFEECLNNNQVVPIIVERSIVQAQNLQIDGVPYFVINNSVHLSGTITITEWRDQIERQLDQLK